MNNNNSIWVCANGNFSKLDQTHIALNNRGFLFGQYVSEVLLIKDGRPAWLTNHFKRLTLGAEWLGIKTYLSELSLKDNTAALLQRVIDSNQTDAAGLYYLKIIITGGNSFDFFCTDEISSQYFLAAKQHPENKLQSVKLDLVLKNDDNNPSFLKSNFYARKIFDLQTAKASGFDEVLFYKSNNELTGCSSANIFFIDHKTNTLHTPSLNLGVLAGITRSKVIEIAHCLNLNVKESLINPSQIKSFDEAFITSSVKGLVPVSSIKGHEFKKLGSDLFSILALEYEKKWRTENTKLI